jgi:hypothetical protein
MSQSLRTTLSAIVCTAGVLGTAVCTVVLARQGLDRAEKWVSIVGVVASMLIAAAGLWLAWRSHAASAPRAPVTAGGDGAVAVGNDNNGRISTEVSGSVPSSAAEPRAPGGVSASGAGSVTIGRDNTAPIRTKVTRPGGPAS